MMERYARLGSWLMNGLGLYFIWANLGLDKPEKPEPHTFLQAVYWAIFLCICRYICTKYLFTRIGSKWIVSKKGKPQKVAKFATCAFKAICFAVLVWFEWKVLSEQEYTPRLLLGAGRTTHLWTPGYIPPPSIVSVFMASLGYHIHSTVYHMLFIEKRSDYNQMVLHHAITLWLMIFAQMEGHLRGGMMIVLLNDVPDIFVYLSKMLGDTIFVKTSILSYVLLTVSYFYFRLIVAPVSIIWSMITEADSMARFDVWVYTGFLGSLYLLHLYWFILIVKIGVNIVTTGSRKDILADITSSDD